MKKCSNYGAEPMVFDSKRNSNYKPDCHRSKVCTADNQINSACLEIGHYISCCESYHYYCAQQDDD